MFHIPHWYRQTEAHVGVTAHYCGVCHDCTVFDVHERRKRHTILFVSVGEGRVELWLAKCRQCGLLVSQTDPFGTVPDVGARGMDGLIRQTNPDYYSEFAHYIDIKERMRRRQLLSADRMILARTAIRFLNIMHRTLTSTPASGLPVILFALLVTAMIVGMIVLLVRFGNGNIENERAQLIAAIVIPIGIPLLLFRMWYHHSILKRRILPLLRRAMETPHIDAQELFDAISTLASDGNPLARQLKKLKPESLIDSEGPSSF